jgi:nicotinamidase-related amidase
MNTKGLLQSATTALLVIDVQERLMPVIHEQDKVIAEVNKLIKGASILGVPTLLTEQYPKGLGRTCQEVEVSSETLVIEKMTFSCMLSDSVMQELQSKQIRSLIVAGVEAHICVLKTVLEALEKGFEVHVVADAVSSRTPQNKQLALERMRQSGAFIVSTEMILFQLMDKAGTEEFKAISKLIK